MFVAFVRGTLCFYGMVYSSYMVQYHLHKNRANAFLHKRKTWLSEVQQGYPLTA